MGQLFFYNNLFKAGTLTASSQSAYFPASNVLTRWPSECWRSNSGVGSGWGNFVITSGVNDRLDFNEGGGALAALLTPGTYTAESLCIHLKAQMQAVGAGTYTWTYGDLTNKFTVTKSAGTLNLKWNSGTNKARSIAGTIGYLDTADDTGALTYTADYIRIHTEEWLKIDNGTTQNVWGAFVKTHNLQVGATLRFQANANDVWTSPSLNQLLTVQDDVTPYIWAAAQAYQFNRLLIQDISNPDGYVKIGVAWAGSRFAPTRNRVPEYDYENQDPSLIKYSSGGQISSVLKDKFKIRNFSYQSPPDSDCTGFETMHAAVGFAKELFMVEDSTTPLTTSRFIKMNSYHTVKSSSGWDIEIAVEDLR